MTGRTSKRPNVRMSIYAAMGGTNRKEPAGLALPALPALEPSPWDEEPFRPERDRPDLYKQGQTRTNR